MCESQQQGSSMNAPINSKEMAALTALARSPAALKQLEDQHAKNVADRQSLNDRIAELDRSAEKTWPAGQLAIETAAKKVRAAERSLRESNDALAKAHTESFNASQAYTRERMAAEGALIEGADLATIAKWKDESLAELNRLQKPGIIVTNVVVSRSEATGKSIKSGVSNMASIVARMKAVSAAYHDADLLKVLPDQRQLPVVIAQIRASWPAIDNNPQPTKA
jgi:hypothetical protein